MVKSTMLSSAAAHWTLLVVFFLCAECMYAVTVKVKATVVTEENTADVILPCEFVLENPNQIYSMRWDMGRDVVIVNDTLNRVFYGEKYTYRVKWGDGCSLILSHPSLNDSGKYRFSIVALGDQNKWETAYVELKVIKAGLKETTSSVSRVPQSTDPTPANKTTEDRRTSPIWEYFIPMTIVSIVTVISQILLMRYRIRHGHIDTKERLFLGIPFVFSGTGFVTVVVSMAVGNRIAFVGVFAYNKETRRGTEGKVPRFYAD
ncbi:uncharacterized protein LOC135462535 [Liolophura sinensis]|uniref:uncharacterized protein LOC135462535 n=1 Tax=Liolophura sinensis TaxID=3198878 RepID=UPI00315819F5